jgi:GntR family transcriptional regulator/MocR family aminotransferase
MKSNKHITSQRFEFETLFLNGKSSTPLFRQLESQLRESIWQNIIKPGERLPSTRVLAKQLQVARNTVINAYEQLTAEGFLITKKGDGTRVANYFETQKKLSTLKNKNNLKLIDIELSIHYKNHANSLDQSLTNHSDARSFRAHTPDTSCFPSKIWAQLAARILRYESSMWLSKTSAQGYKPLRSAISGYLGATRGVNTNHQHISITAGAQQGIELLAKLLINPGDVVVFEDPGYTHAITVFEMAGATVISIPVDEFGLNVEKLSLLKVKVKLIYTTPTSHFPLSVCLSQARRKLIIEWAQQNNSLIIEDDYNGEYRYSGRPLATLYEQCDSEHIIYMGSFSKLLFPGLRIGFLVTPLQFIEPLKKLRWLLDRHSPTLEQAVLTDFINDGHFSRHLRKMRTLYFERQQFLLKAVNKHLSDILKVPPLDGGLHLIGWLQDGVEENNLLQAANEANVELIPTSIYQQLPIEKPSVILGYASYSEEQLLKGVLALKRAYHHLFCNINSCSYCTNILK